MSLRAEGEAALPPLPGWDCFGLRPRNDIFIATLLPYLNPLSRYPVALIKIRHLNPLAGFSRLNAGQNQTQRL